VFRFGRATEATHVRDRLSVYGIGLKRAMFKLGRVIKIRSGHVQGGFDLNVDVDKWELDPNQPWTFPITKRAPVPATDCGTTIEITRLHEDAVRRLSDGVFAGQLRDRIARTYEFYMAKFVNIYVDGELVDPIAINIGANHTSQIFD